VDNNILFTRQRKYRFFNLWLMRSDSIVFQLVVNQSKVHQGELLTEKKFTVKVKEIENSVSLVSSSLTESNIQITTLPL